MPAVGTPQPVFCFVQGAPCHLHEATVVQVATPPYTFGNIRPDAVGSSHNLPSDGMLGEVVPAPNNGPDCVSQSFGKLVYFQILEIRP
jgi:hypothetical protein